MFLVTLVNYTAFGKQHIDILTSQFILVIGVLKMKKKGYEMYANKMLKIGCETEC